MKAPLGFKGIINCGKMICNLDAAQAQPFLASVGKHYIQS
jgi:hypothetical protein